MKPLIVLLSVFLLTAFLIKRLKNKFDWFLAGRIAMSAMLLFTAIGHFAFTKGMTMMVPPFIPYKKEIVYFTGFFEMFAAVGLLIPRFSKMTAWILILFLIMILPANIYASMKQVNYQKGTLDGAGLSYLWIRIPMQLFFILWIYFFTHYKNARQKINQHNLSYILCLVTILVFDH